MALFSLKENHRMAFEPNIILVLALSALALYLLYKIAKWLLNGKNGNGH